MFTPTELRISRAAEGQAGHVTRQQLIAAGLHPSTIARRSADGRLVPVGARTFRAPWAPRTPFGDVVAATLDTGGVASHWTAAWLHGVTEHRDEVDVTVTRRGPMYERKRRFEEQPSVRVHSSTNLPAADVAVHEGVRVTSVARTGLGLAALVPHELDRKQLFDIVGKMVDQDLATDPWLWWLLAQRRCRGRNGVVELEAVLAARAKLGPTESWLEREVLRLLGEAGLPLPKTQRRIRRRGRFVARVDFVYEGSCVVIEALGYAHHRTRAQLRDDTMRANDLQLQGYVVLQFTFDQIVGAPRTMLASIEAALARSGHRRAA